MISPPQLSGDILPDGTPDPGGTTSTALPQSAPSKHKPWGSSCPSQGWKLAGQALKGTAESRRTSQECKDVKLWWKHTDNQSCFCPLINPSQCRSKGNEGLFSLKCGSSPCPSEQLTLCSPEDVGMLPCACDPTLWAGWEQHLKSPRKITLIKISNRSWLFLSSSEMIWPPESPASCFPLI